MALLGSDGFAGFRWLCWLPMALPASDGFAGFRWLCRLPMALLGSDGFAGFRWLCWVPMALLASDGFAGFRWLCWLPMALLASDGFTENLLSLTCGGQTDEVAKFNSPYRPGVGAVPLCIADRAGHTRRFFDHLDAEDHILLTGPSGAGKTVLLKQYEEISRDNKWAVVRKNLSPAFRNEEKFTTEFKEALQELTLQLSKRRGFQAKAARVFDEIEFELGVGLSSTAARAKFGRQVKSRSLESALTNALIKVGTLAQSSKSEQGIVLLYDEAHVLTDSPQREQFPLSSLIAAFGTASHDKGLPVVLVLAGHPVLRKQVIGAAGGHADRLFSVEKVEYLSLQAEAGLPSQAALALIEPPKKMPPPIRFAPATAELIGADVQGYPFFIQYYGHVLWRAAKREGIKVIDDAFYIAHRQEIADTLDESVYEGHFEEAGAADQVWLSAAGSLGGEEFRLSDVRRVLRKSVASVDSSRSRLIELGIIEASAHGWYHYLVPLFGDFLRRKHP
jgi:type II secretory pathway predicted ATPase ExeA